MLKKLFFSQFIYIIVLVFYYWLIKLINHVDENGSFEIILFDYWRNGIVLYAVFLFTNLIYFFMKYKSYSTNYLYPLLLFWISFVLFLIITALVFFYGFTSIGAPFKQNIFLNLLIVHIISFKAIRVVLQKVS